MTLFSAFRKLAAPKPVMERPSAILLRHRRTGLYYSTAGGWTFDPEKAMAFDDFLRACLFSESAKLANVEIVLRTDQGERTFSVSETQCSGHRRD